MNDFEYMGLIAGATLAIHLFGATVFWIMDKMDEADRQQRLRRVIHLGPGSERLNQPAKSEEQEIREIMWREDFAVHNGKVYCTECKSTGPLCGQCSNTGAYNRCQAYYDRNR